MNIHKTSVLPLWLQPENPILPVHTPITPIEVARQDRRNDEMGSQCGALPFGPHHHSANSYYEDELSDEALALIARWSSAIRWTSVIICGALLPVICTCIAAT